MHELFIYLKSGRTVDGRTQCTKTSILGSLRSFRIFSNNYYLFTANRQKVKGETTISYLGKCMNYPLTDAKWMEEIELADSSELY